jgi:alkylation response protein AidB-like acyl-CoA dehydrogenase
VLRGDHYVVNGQKVWTSEAKWADWCLLLVRTEEDVPNHRSMSCFVVPVDSPGLAVRPFRQITGAMEFSELFLDDLEIPAANLVGAAGQGWQIAMSTVSFERGPGDVGDLADLRASLGRLAEMVGALGPGPGGGGGSGDRVVDDRREAARRSAVLDVARMRVELEVLRVHIATSLSRRSKGLATEAEASVDKLLMVRTQQALGHAVLDVLGAGPLLGDEPEALYQYLWSRAASVYGGSEQIQRTLVATRLLGLPRGA